MSRIFSALLLIAAVLGTALPASAQEGGLTDDQQALLQRVLEAMQRSEGYTSFVYTVSEQVAQSVTLRVEDQALEATSRRVVDQRVAFRLGLDDVPEFSNQFAVTTTDLEFGAAQSTAYTLSGETRGIGSTLYVSAARDTLDDAGMPPMPEGWVIVGSADEWPALRSLTLQDTIDNLGSPDIYDVQIGELLAPAAGASSAAGTLGDGTPVEVITIRLEGAGLGAGLAASVAQDSTTESLYRQIDAASTWVLAFLLTPDGDIVAFHSDGNFTWTGVNAQLLSPTLPDGTLLDQTLTIVGEYTIADINAPAAPVVAPEL